MVKCFKKLFCCKKKQPPPPQNPPPPEVPSYVLEHLASTVRLRGQTPGLPPHQQTGLAHNPEVQVVQQIDGIVIHQPVEGDGSTSTGSSGGDQVPSYVQNYAAELTPTNPESHVQYEYTSDLPHNVIVR